MRVALLVEIGIALAAAAVVLVHASRNGSFTFPRFDPDRPNPGWPFGYAPAVGGLVSLASMFSLVTGISWLVWQHRAHTNVWALPTPTRPEFSPGWAVGWWFVPLANLVLPVLTMRETSRRSAEATGRTASPITLAAWWGCWVATSVGTIAGVFAVLGVFASKFSDAIDPSTGVVSQFEVSVAEVRAGLIVLGLSYVARAAAAVLAMLVVTDIERDQATIAAAGPPIPVRPDLDPASWAGIG